MHLDKIISYTKSHVNLEFHESSRVHNILCKFVKLTPRDLNNGILVENRIMTTVQIEQTKEFINRYHHSYNECFPDYFTEY